MLPNLLTIVRIGLIPFVALAILSGNFGRALILFLIAGLSDALDGFLARILDQVTDFGTYLDPAADKLLLVTVYFCLGFAGLIPVWMVAIVFGRDLLIVGMVAYGVLFTRFRKFPPTIWGKASTLVQIAAVLVAMWAGYGMAAPVNAVLWCMVAVTVWSGVHYAWLGLSRLRSIDGASGRG